MLPAMKTTGSGRIAAAQALILALVGGLVGLGVNGIRTEGLPLDRPVLAQAETDVFACQVPDDAIPGVVAPVDLDGALDLFGRGAAFVDARGPAAFAEGHVAGAWHLEPAGACQEADALMGRLLSAPAVVVYGRAGAPAAARTLAAELAGRGVADVRVMEAGFAPWLADGRPAMSGPCQACMGVAYGGGAP